jgi:hypothetical protein
LPLSILYESDASAMDSVTKSQGSMAGEILFIRESNVDDRRSGVKYERAQRSDERPTVAPAHGTCISFGRRKAHNLRRLALDP